MASDEIPVNLFDLSTWPRGVDFNPLCGMIHEMIAPHMSQNQQIESYAEMNAGAAKKHGKEVR